MSTVVDALLTAFHRMSFANHDLLASELEVSCFFCLGVSNSYEVTYVTERARSAAPGAKTAICPKCGVDAVLPGRMTPATLSAMQDLYFKRVHT